MYRLQVVADEEEDDEPSVDARCVHAKDHHEHAKLDQKGELDDAVVTQEPDCDVLIVVLACTSSAKAGHIGGYVIGHSVEVKALLEAAIHDGQSGKQ